MEIVKDEKILRTVSTLATFDEAQEIWKKLEEVLTEKGEVALSAIQINIPKKVALIKLGNKTFKLLNTNILNKSDSFIFKNEGCLSFPKIFKNTIRYKSIEVVDENMGHFVCDVEHDGILPILIQHEVDHLNGILFFDRMQKPIKIKEKIGRNELCPCGSGKKYKKCCLIFG